MVQLGNDWDVPERKRQGGVLTASARKTFTDPGDAPQTTGVFDARAFARKNVSIVNTSNKAVEYTLQASVDDTFPTNSTHPISTGTLAIGSVTTQRIYIPFTDNWSFVRLEINPDGAATGTVLAELSAQEA